MLVLFLLVCAMPASAAPRVLLDGQPLSFDVPPTIEQGRVLVPMRAIFQALGAELEWDGATQTVTATRGRTTVILTIGSKTVFKNGSPVVLDVPAKIINGRTVVPLRFVSEALGAGVDWDAATQTVTIFSGTSPAEESQGVAPKPETSLIEREFAWDYGGKHWTWRLVVPEEAYTYYTNLKRPPTDDYSVYVTDPADDAFISCLAARLKETAVREKYSPKQTVEFVVTFVQNIKYAHDNVSKGVEEYPGYPLETLVDQEGDCEDHSILLASVLKEMDYGVVLICIPGEHMAVGVKGKDLPGAYYEYEGARYYYVETTATGWSIGKIPDEYLRAKARIFPLVPRSVLTHKWTLKGAAGGWLELKVEVSNDGT
ncbi:MAG: Copper amine oxidase domain protein, partial [Clostridia bacterium 62_21]